jgi:HlyD family secretion protein
MPKSDAKVFEVKIRVFGNVENLKPAMTTSNLIQAGFIPILCMCLQKLCFRTTPCSLYILIKEQPLSGLLIWATRMRTYFLIRKGLDEGDVVLLTEPENPSALAIEGMDIYYEIKERRKQEEEEARKKMEEDRSQPFKLQKKSGGNSGNVIIIG